MRLAELEGKYDSIFSLGDLCLASIQLEKNNLRLFSGVLDWVGSPQLPEVSRLLMNRFTGFMELENLRVVGDAGADMLLVSDEYYHIFSNHDFSKVLNPNNNLFDYPNVKQKFDRRIQRFLEKMENSERILFVRTEGNLQEVYDLQMVLAGLVKHDFRILVINHAPVDGIVELNWPIEKVCAVQFPDGEKWAGNDELWKTMLKGIHHL
ncbi:DUF1796 family putative cysteine peptidase [Paenibacillus crassostreae]|uniref:Peptidase n=1 Tax=Paenibacillus crassostreae TaxID=1763538 RepID=A0A167FZE1_9BACL|nr:DUF1796 family putative cysteine peptidase [Paenibacillus crassostreae]AOZ93917.1 peptidase [Paenibacillus crassostreae]OAB77050.1 peptidase [Paenibacillus crassostreae]